MAQCSNNANMVRNNNQARIYNLDLTVTDDCNFNCRYCFEHGYFNKHKFNQVDNFNGKIYAVLKSNFFNTNFDVLNIGFWGGEPTLNPEVIRAVVNEFADNDKVKFFCFSNGYSLDRIMDIHDRFKYKKIMGHPKFCQQISYDGEKVHNLTRKHKDGQATGAVVRARIKEFMKYEFPYTIKATICPDHFKHMESSYDDLLELQKLIEGKGIYHGSGYFPTIEYYGIDKYTDDEIDTYEQDLTQSLINMAKKDKDYYLTHNRYFFSWFNPGRALCSAGVNLLCVNHDGKVYKCHGALYETELNEHFVADIADDDEKFITNLESTHNYHKQDFQLQPLECMDCVAPFCLRCNAAKYSVCEKASDKTYIEKWRDYTNQPRLCRLYKSAGKITKALESLR